MKLNKLFILISLTTTLSIMPNGRPLLGQSTDHLSIVLQFQDSLLQINAVYRATVKADTDSLFFTLNPDFEITDITSPGLEAYELSTYQGRPFPFWLLRFDRELKKGEVVDISFDYRVDLEKQNHWASDWIELNADKIWAPNYHDIDNKFSYDVTIENVPAGYSFIAHPKAMMKKQNGKIEISSVEKHPEVLLLAGKHMTYWTPKSDSITIIAHQDTPEDTLLSMYEKVRNSINFFNEAFGAADPITAFTVVLRNTTTDEIGFQFSRKNLIVTGVEFNSHGSLSHEVAHYWWGEADFVKEPWLNESFANYSMYLVVEEFEPHSYQAMVERHRDLTREAMPVAEAELFMPKASLAYYTKGAVLLKDLEERIGRKKMEELLALRVSKKINTTAGFLAGLEELTDSQTRRFFEQLLRK